MIISINLTDDLLAEALRPTQSVAIRVEEVSDAGPPSDNEDRPTVVARQLWEVLKRHFVAVNRGGPSAYRKNVSVVRLLLRRCLRDNKQHAEVIAVALRGHISAFQGRLLQTMSRQLLPQTIELEKERLVVDQVSVSFEFCVSGDLQASITQLFKLAASGKVSMSAAYRRNSSAGQMQN
jgi:hypothetical protein